MQLFKNKREEGFTIIEIMIVLTIAAVILLIVFLAVPALERASRNNSRKNDASRIAAAVSTFVSNNNGILPNTSAQVNTIIQNAGTLAQYNITDTSGAYSTTSGTPVSDEFLVTTAAPAGTGPAANDSELVLFISSSCNTTAGANGIWATSQTGSREAALVYPIEVTNTSTGYEWQCVNAL